MRGKRREPDSDECLPCTACGQRKPEAEFYSRTEGRCRACLRARASAQSKARTAAGTDRERRRQRSEQWRAKNPDEVKEYAARWVREKRSAIRLRVLAHYGARCSCCGETEPAFLCIDHVNGGGNAHRRTIGTWVNIYQWLERENYPDGYQVLCHNCNFAKSHGGCPHQLARV